MLRLTAGGDPNGEAFSCYSRCLAQVGSEPSAARIVRIFELELLSALGYGVELDGESSTGERRAADTSYAYELGLGIRRVDIADSAADVYSRRHLISLRERALDDDASLKTANRLLGRVLRAHLGERPLQSRRVLQDIVS